MKMPFGKYEGRYLIDLPEYMWFGTVSNFQKRTNFGEQMQPV
jgi:uncharacterized protein (DUF3820 family)